jgi:uncharacterized protein (DUF1330 family)
MTFEIVMGLHVIDDEEYQKYREGMEPILNSVGGSFGFFLNRYSVTIKNR